jgi:hypothetical protein
VTLGDFGIDTVLAIAKDGFDAWSDVQKLDQSDQALELQKQQLEAQRAALEQAKVAAEEAARERAASALSSGGASAGGGAATPGGLLASIPVAVLVVGSLGLGALVLYLLTRGRK